MSEALTMEAPSEGAAAAAPALDLAVEGGSADNEELKVVPVDRFNGLMKRYQSDKTDYESQIRVLESELDKARKKGNKGEQVAKPEQASDPRVEQLIEQNAQLMQLLQARELESARQAVINKYPDAAPFADLIRGSSAEEMEQVASVLHERMQLLKGDAPASTSATEAAATAAADTTTEVDGTEEPPVIGGTSGGGTAAGEATLDEAVNTALQSKDFSAFLNAKWAKTEAALAAAGA